MEIRKISDNQIRFVLDQSDLSSRHLSISELAYGSEKASRLFSEMVSLANNDYDFDSEGSPLMVEAIPMEHDELMLILTKTDDPEELDTRFAKFAPLSIGNSSVSRAIPEKFLSPENTPEEGVQYQIFRFSSLDSVISSSRFLSTVFSGHCQLYKLTENTFYLVLFRGTMELSTFQQIGNELSEYTKRMPNALQFYSYLNEHHVPVMEDMLSSLAKL